MGVLAEALSLSVPQFPHLDHQASRACLWELMRSNRVLPRNGLRAVPAATPRGAVGWQEGSLTHDEEHEPPPEQKQCSLALHSPGPCGPHPQPLESFPKVGFSVDITASSYLRAPSRHLTLADSVLQILIKANPALIGPHPCPKEEAEWMDAPEPSSGQGLHVPKPASPRAPLWLTCSSGSPL